MSLLITGASGYLGQKVLESLLKDTSYGTIYLLLREKSFRELSSQYEEVEHIKCVKGDLSSPDVFEDQKDFSFLKNEITHIIHLGALYDLEASEAMLVKTNTIGTQNLLFFASYCRKLVGLHYASTIAVAGNHDGPFCEDDFNLKQEFGDSYAYSKYKAEEAVRTWAKKNTQVRVDIFRFGIIVGDSTTGLFEKVDGIYYFLKVLVDLNHYTSLSLKSPIYPFPFNGDMKLPIVTVDYARDVCLSVLGATKKGIFTYHVLNKDLPSLSEFLEDFLEAMGHKTTFYSLPRNFLIDKVLKRGLPLLGLPKELLGYMYLKTNFVTLNCEKYLECKNPSYQDFHSRLFKTAILRFQDEAPRIGPKAIESINSFGRFIRRHV